MEHRAKDVVENVMDTHGHFARRHGDMSQSLSHVSPVSLEGSGAQRRPYKSFDDAFFAGAEGVHVRVRLPLLEQKLYLPAQTVSIAELSHGELRAPKIAHQVARGGVVGASADDETTAQRLIFAAILHVHIDTVIALEAVLEFLQRFVLPSFYLGAVVAIGVAHGREKWTPETGQCVK